MESMNEATTSEKEPKFKTMAEAREWVKTNGRCIQEYECPKFNKEHPTEADLEECGMMCSNRWACHTFRHIYGSR